MGNGVCQGLDVWALHVRLSFRGSLHGRRIFAILTDECFEILICCIIA